MQESRTDISVVIKVDGHGKPYQNPARGDNHSEGKTGRPLKPIFPIGCWIANESKYEPSADKSAEVSKVANSLPVDKLPHEEECRLSDESLFHGFLLRSVGEGRPGNVLA